MAYKLGNTAAEMRSSKKQLTTAEVAQWLGVSARMVRMYIKQGKMYAIYREWFAWNNWKYHRHAYLIPIQEVHRFMARNALTRFGMRKLMIPEEDELKLEDIINAKPSKTVA